MSNYINPFKLFYGCMIPNWLMERAEISANAKIVYSRLAQHGAEHGRVYPSLPALSKECAIALRTLSRAIEELEEFKLIESKRRGLGMSNVYFFLKHDWMKFRVAMDDMSDLPPVSDQDLPPVANKVNQLRESKKKEEESLPLPFASSEFEEAWKEWEQHRKELKAKLTPSTKRKQFKTFLQWGEKQSIEAIHTSISRGWTGCFSVPDKKSPADGRNISQPKKEEPEEKPETPQWKFRLDRMLKEVTDENASPLHMAWFNAMPAVGRQAWHENATKGQIEALNEALNRG